MTHENCREQLTKALDEITSGRIAEGVRLLRALLTELDREIGWHRT